MLNESEKALTEALSEAMAIKKGPGIAQERGPGSKLMAAALSSGVKLENNPNASSAALSSVASPSLPLSQFVNNSGPGGAWKSPTQAGSYPTTKAKLAMFATKTKQLNQPSWSAYSGCTENGAQFSNQTRH